MVWYNDSLHDVHFSTFIQTIILKKMSINVAWDPSILLSFELFRLLYALVNFSIIKTLASDQTFFLTNRKHLTTGIAP